MERPIARIIDPQQVDTTIKEVDGWEAEQLLRKYGHSTQQYYSTKQEPVTLEQGLTFEEMVLQHENKIKADELRRQHQQNGPKPITFNSQGGYTTEVKYSTDDDTGFGFKIEVTSDMNLPRY
jgi:uncharacterized protein YifE (UPF0438 family)